MTVQAKDVVVYEQRRYMLGGLRGEGLLRPADFGLQTKTLNTACYRGYLCEYEVRGQELFLSSFSCQTWSGQYPELHGVQAAELEFWGHAYSGLDLPCPLSGGLVLVEDLVGLSPVIVRPSRYDTVVELRFAEGRLHAVTDWSEQAQEIRAKIKALDSERNKLRSETDHEARDRSKRDVAKRRPDTRQDSLEWSYLPGYVGQPPLSP